MSDSPEPSGRSLAVVLGFPLLTAAIIVVSRWVDDLWVGLATGVVLSAAYALALFLTGSAGRR